MSGDLNGTPLDTREKLEAWIECHRVALAEAKARGEYVGSAGAKWVLGNT